jgi:hypothetical protein
MQTLLRWTGRSESTLETVETTLRAMDEGNVDIALLSAWHGPPEGCLISNEETAQMVAAAPSRFRGLASDFPTALREWPDGKIRDTYVRYALPRERDRTSPDQDQASLDQWPGRTHEPHDQGSDRPTLPLRSTRSAPSSPCRLHQRLQLRSAAEDSEGPHALRIHLQMLDFPARTIQTQSAPANAGTNT